MNSPLTKQPGRSPARSLRHSLAGLSGASDIFRYVGQILFAILIGLLAGLGAMFFHHVVELMRAFLSHPCPPRTSLYGILAVIMVPVAGGLLVAGATALFPRLAAERGVTSVIKALIINNGFIPLKTTLFHMTAAILTIGTGAPLGPEEPVARIGSGIGSFFSRQFRLNRSGVKVFTAAGAGAAISAVFNAPIAGVFFGIEVILLNDLKNQALSFLIIASVVGDISSRALLGNELLFTIPDYPMIAFTDYPWFLAFALCCGLLSLFFFGTRSLFSNLFDRVPFFGNPFLRLLPVSFLFGLALLKFDTLYGIGYNTIHQVLNSGFPLTTVLWLLTLRIIFLALFLTAGAYGGTYAPALVIGAMFGFVFATAAGFLFGVRLDPVAFSLVGMGGMLAGMNSIPLTAMLLVFEMTRDYRIILPLMLASILSYVVVMYVNKRTVYAQALLKDGIDVSSMGEVDILGRVKVKELMTGTVETVSYRTPFRELLARLLHSAYGEVCVTDDKGGLMGVISLKSVRQALITQELVDLLIAGDLIIPIPAVDEDDPVSAALENIQKFDVENIPVVASREDPAALTGILRHQDILQAYQTLREEWATDRFLTNYHFRR
ncbi:MAG: chloride channel protein [Thermodesulfobacteriota bacterium]